MPLVASCLLSACSLAPSSAPAILESALSVPDRFAGSGVAGSYDPLEWWKTFADPVLDHVVEEVLASSFDLAEAVARVEQARMQARIARAPVFPLIQPSLSGNDFDTPTNAGIGAQLDELGLGSALEGVSGIALPDRLGLTTYSSGLEFAYEVDFWGRNRNDANAAGAIRLASESDYQSARIGVLAEAVGTYLEVVNLRNQQRLADEIAEISEQLESLARSRYDRGLTDVRALYAARRNLREAQAEVPQIEALRAEAEGRLWVLLGGYREDLAAMLPDSLTPSADLPPIPAGIPADLLVQRPDVSAAMQRVDAARYSVGARRSDLLAATVPAGIHRAPEHGPERVVQGGPMVPKPDREPAWPDIPGRTASEQCRPRPGSAERGRRRLRTFRGRGGPRGRGRSHGTGSESQASLSALVRGGRGPGGGPIGGAAIRFGCGLL